jgi:hypothetical protein
MLGSQAVKKESKGLKVFLVTASCNPEALKKAGAAGLQTQQRKLVQA